MSAATYLLRMELGVEEQESSRSNIQEWRSRNPVDPIFRSGGVGI